MSRRRPLLASIAVSVAVAASLAAMPSVSADTSAAKGREAWLFTVESASGSATKLKISGDEDERFRLTLEDVSPVTQFSDRPFRNSRLISPAALQEHWQTWFGDSPPNAVLTFQVDEQSHEAPRSMVVTLTSPRYDAAADSMSFTAIRDQRRHDPSEKGKNWIRATTPKSFGSASLFIDDAYNCGPEASCQGMDLNYAQLAGAVFTGADWTNTRAEYANMQGIDLNQINGSNVDFSMANLYGAHLMGANLQGASLLKVDARNADFSNANLQGTDFSYGNFSGADFSNANLTGANVTGANFENAKFNNAVLKDVLPADAQNSIDSGAAITEHVAVTVACAVIPPPFDLLCEAVATGVEEWQLATGH